MHTVDAIASARSLLATNALREWGLLCRDVESSAIERHDLDGLVSFHEASLTAVATPEQFHHIRVKNIERFGDGFADCLSRALVKARANPAIQALYFEYFYDGGDASDGNIFLCESFDPDDENWAANFGRDGVVPGPSVLPWMHFDPEIELPEPLRTVAMMYVDANLLVACLREIDALGGIEYPFGFAQHDAPVTLCDPAR
jgi:hypothetical protein